MYQKEKETKHLSDIIISLMPTETFMKFVITETLLEPLVFALKGKEENPMWFLGKSSEYLKNMMVPIDHNRYLVEIANENRQEATILIYTETPDDQPSFFVTYLFSDSYEKIISEAFPDLMKNGKVGFGEGENEIILILNKDPFGITMFYTKDYPEMEKRFAKYKH